MTKKPNKKTAKHTDTTISLAPLTVDEALSALLKTPPPPKTQMQKDSATMKKWSADAAKRSKEAKADGRAARRRLDDLKKGKKR